MKIIWNSKQCGRCGGSGAYHFGQYASKGQCYQCFGAGRITSPVTRKNARAFDAWYNATKRTFDEVREVLASGQFGRSFRIED